MGLADQTCKPCTGTTPALSDEQSTSMLKELDGWKLENKRLRKSIKTKDFKSAIDLANRIGALAEEQQHHPDLLVRWGELAVELWTHAINGLSEADFVLAAKIDRAVSGVG